MSSKSNPVIPYGRQDISSKDIDAVKAVLNSDYLTQGPVVPAFEKRLVEYCNASYAVAASNATAALHLACRAVGIGKGDLVWTSGVTFVASANCAVYCGADVDFVDIDARTYNMSCEALSRKLDDAAKQGKLPKAIIPVHLTGQSCDMRTIRELTQPHGISIIEDASHAIGGSFANRKIGSCEFSDIAVFSFHPVKIITTGEGGLCTTNQPEVAKRIDRLRSHGINREPEGFQFPSDGGWYYEQIELGYNYRMTEIQAALGLSQMDRLDEFVGRRHEIANRYNKLLQDLPFQTPYQSPDGYSAFHLYVVRVNSSVAKTHREVFASLRRQGIGVNLHYIPVYRHPYYRDRGYDFRHFPESEAYYSQAISLPLFPKLTSEMQDRVVDALAASIDS